MLAIVGQQPVAVFSHPGARAANRLLGVENRRYIGSDPDRATVRETSESHLLHRSAMKSVTESRVMHDLAIANIDSVV
jgi:hypothetical protein